jgi:hypothetical protein
MVRGSMPHCTPTDMDRRPGCTTSKRIRISLSLTRSSLSTPFSSPITEQRIRGGFHGLCIICSLPQTFHRNLSSAENNSPVSPYRESQGAVIDAYVQIDPLQGGREDFDPWYDADGCRMGVCTLACSLHLPASIKSFPVAWNIIICEAWFISLRSASVSATIPVKAGPDNPLSLDFWGLWPYEL